MRPAPPSMAPSPRPGYVFHLADDSGLFTACGEPWQGWQGHEPSVGPNQGRLLPPYDPPRPHVDAVRSCGACRRATSPAPPSSGPSSPVPPAPHGAPR
jgi:hypothetical protein